MDKAEIQQKIESSFPPYDCRVEFLPRGQPDWEELGIQLSEVNYKLPLVGVFFTWASCTAL